MQGGKDQAARLTAMTENMVAHMSYLPSRHPGMFVERRDDLTIIDSGLACDTFNFICLARFDEAAAAARIREAAGHFQGRPFAWWVSPGDRPATLEALLEEAGFTGLEAEPGMTMDLADLPADEAPAELRVERATTARHLADYAGVLATLWEPPDENVLKFYEMVSEQALAEESPMRFYVGYVDDLPVASSELCLCEGAAGLYNIATLATHRRRGYGRAMTLRPLHEARAAGARLATLQASPDGFPVYRKIGFTTAGWYREFQREP